MANVKISQLPNYTGNTQNAWLVINDSGETTSYKVKKEYFFAAAGFSWVNPGTGGNYPTSDQYGNLVNNSDNYMPFNTTIFNNNTDVFELVNSGSVSGTLGDTGARIFIKQPGIYEFTGQGHFFDIFGNIDFLIEIASASTQNGAMTQVTLLHDYKSNESTTDQMMSGTVMLNIPSAGYYTMFCSIVQSTPGNLPFPSATDNTPTRLFIKKID
jgi:hypothetical protein